MDKNYDPQAIERRWYDTWEKHGWFAPQGGGAPYCILLPPPNVTGTLHMGHAFQQTLMDILIRYHRMRGERVLWQGGTDHAGIATQKIVENQLAAENKTRHDLGRARFIERVWQWKQESGSVISRQMRRLGASIDWSRERFTLDEGLSATVRRVFVKWYCDGLIYRGNRLVNWDPVLMTAVSDLEVNNVERDGHLWFIRYPAVDGSDGVVVATTRPETMLGDVAVAVHTDDNRYKKFTEKKVKLKLPLTGREIQVIADESVDKDFGTGAVKITPAHDFSDYAIGQRHNLDMINVLSLDAKVRKLADVHHPDGTVTHSSNVGTPSNYVDLDRYDARKRIIADLEAQGLLVDTKPHKLQLPVSQRSDAVIEPMLTDQWFLDLTSSKGRKAITEPALNAVRNGKIKFVPENWATTYTQWLENIQDWCVSRQLWWGHRIPAWYDKHGKYYVAETPYEAHGQWLKATDNAGVVHKANLQSGDTNEQIDQKLLNFGWPERLRQDNDVLDTWFSSALWPFSTLGWPADGPVKNDRCEIVADWSHDQIFLPSSVLVTGFDIIFFWVARMVMATKYFTGRVPFKEVYINAIVRDAEGQKMSKSKGNTLDPLDLMDGVELDALLKKSIASLMIPQVRAKVEKRIRHDYPDGIPAVGADALRFTFAALATYSRTINFDLKRCEGYRNFCTKLWNATRFVLMNCEGYTAGGKPPLKTPAEHWIVNKLDHLLIGIEAHFKTYRFDMLAQDLYEFTWNDFCDWFLELSKPALNGPDPEAAASTRHTLLYVLETLLRALHPIIPFITEELWQQVVPKLGQQGKAISLEPYPKFEQRLANPSLATGDIARLIAAVIQIRGLRSENNLPPSTSIPLLIEDRSNDPHFWQRMEPSLKFLARVESLRVLSASEQSPPSAVAVLDQATLMIPLAGLIDVEAELMRLGKQLDKLRADLQRTEAKLDNDAFVSRAPVELVDKERARAIETGNAIGELEKQMTNLRRFG